MHKKYFNYTKLNSNKLKHSGSVMVIVVVLISILGVISIQFINRSARFNSMAVTGFSQMESRLFSEAAVNMLYSKFLNDFDINKDGSADNQQLGFDPANSPPALSYLYYITSDGTTIDQTAPSLLQRVANGEARKLPVTSVSSQAISHTNNQLTVGALSSSTFSPQIYITDNNGQLLLVKDNFSTMTANKKAAVWLEIIADAQDSTRLNIYVQGVSQVDDAKTYVQRYVGTIFIQNPAILGRNIAPLTQNG